LGSGAHQQRRHEGDVGAVEQVDPLDLAVEHLLHQLPQHLPGQLVQQAVLYERGRADLVGIKKGCMTK